MRFTFYAALLFSLLLGSSITGLAASGRDEFKVTEVFLKADDGRPTGPCPLRVTFRGYITANGPGTVKYTFTRSDRATGPVYVLEFKQAGTQAVMTDWTLGDPRTLPRYAGWQAVKVLSPVEIESNRDTGSFEISCKGKDASQSRKLNPQVSGGQGVAGPPAPESSSKVTFDNTLLTDPFGIRQGQTARLEIANTGDQSLIVWLFFHDSEGKVLKEKRVTVRAHANEALEYSIRFPHAPGRNSKGHYRDEFVRAQFAINETTLPASLQPTLRIFETSNGETIRLIGPDGFKKAQLGPPVSEP